MSVFLFSLETAACWSWKLHYEHGGGPKGGGTGTICDGSLWLHYNKWLFCTTHNLKCWVNSSCSIFTSKAEPLGPLYFNLQDKGVNTIKKSTLEILFLSSCCALLITHNFTSRKHRTKMHNLCLFKGCTHLYWAVIVTPSRTLCCFWFVLLWCCVQWLFWGKESPIKDMGRTGLI